MEGIKDSICNILLDSISDMVFVMEVIHNEDFVYTYLNRTAMEKSEFKHSIIGKTIHEVHSDKTAPVFHEYYKRAAHNKSNVTYKDSYVSAMGDVRYSETTLTPIVDKDEKCCTYIIAIVKDITNDILIAEQLEESEKHFRIIAENADDLITLINDKGEIIYASPSYKKILGFDHKEYVGKLFSYNVHLEDRASINKVFMKAMKYGQPFGVECRQYNHNDEAIWTETHGTPVYDTNKAFKHMVLVTRNISKQKRYEEKLKYFALHDSLTGLPNRRLFNKHLSDELKNMTKSKGKLAVIMLDIDDFKDINDELGHDVGDDVIEEYGKRVCQSIGKNDIVARLGGDEFVILLPNITKLKDATHIAKNIQLGIQKPWDIKGNVIKVTTSMGIAMTSASDVIADSILKNADIALYEAKRAGGNMYKVKKENQNLMPSSRKK